MRHADIAGLMRHADVAMYQAKSTSRDNLQFFTPELNERVMRRLQLENDLRHAVERDELVLYYQPRIHAKTGLLAGVESLVRWMHPQRGLVPPGDFIPIAEESGLIGSIGAWIIGEACRQHQLWRRAGMGAVPVQNMHSAPQNLAVTNTIIGLGHTLGLQVVAEGVEHEADVELLRAAGCDELQGFYYSRALPTAEAQAWMVAHAEVVENGGRLRRA